MLPLYCGPVGSYCCWSVQRMKLPDVYSDWRVVFGLRPADSAGIGNWVVGWEKAQFHAQLAATESKGDGHSEPSYRSFDELAGDPGGALSRRSPLKSARSQSLAPAWISYHATFPNRLHPALLGLLFSCIGFLGLIRNDGPPRRYAPRNLRTKAEEPFSRLNQIAFRAQSLAPAFLHPYGQATE